MIYMRDSNMEAARLKIMAVLKEHDLMGSVLICGKERSGFFSELSPSWSCASISEGLKGMELRIRAKKEDFPSKEVQQETLRATVHGIFGLHHVHANVGEMLKGLIQIIGKHMNVQSIAYDEQIQTVRAPQED